MATDGMSEDEFKKRRRRRNWAILAALAGWCVLIYLITLVRMGGG